MKIDDVLQNNTETLMAIPGVTGVGIGESEGKPAIVIMVIALTPELEGKLPGSLNGFEVRIEVTGEISAF